MTQMDKRREAKLERLLEKRDELQARAHAEMKFISRLTRQNDKDWNEVHKLEKQLAKQFPNAEYELPEEGYTIISV